MKIIDYFFNDNNQTLTVDFSTDIDEDIFYRQIELEFADIQFYSPTIITKSELRDIDEDTIIEILSGYLLKNDLPEQLSL
jgi:hypothetical protein